MVATMVLLFIVTTISVGFHWSYFINPFIDNSQSFWWRFSVLEDRQDGILLGMGITGAISTILADSTMPVHLALLNSLGAVLACCPTSNSDALLWNWCNAQGLFISHICPQSDLVFKLMNTYQGYTNGRDYVLGFVLYLSFILATTIWCTSLIIYRILTVRQASNGIGSRVGVYRHVIEVLIESSALHSFVLILDMAFEVREEWADSSVDAMAAIMRGIAPTLLVGRVTTGHARSDQSWQGSVMSSLQFGTRRFRALDQSSIEVETLQSVGIDEDWEGVRGEMDRHKHIRTESQEYSPPSNVTLQDDFEAQPESVGDRYGEAIGHTD
ncbi:hypothetical protein EDD85DRAFT_573234 [Armillaria nabsnona]|nr:hypothetical protein EDD85DRAFT_573234 [Armillaria nabsnona]